MCVYIYIYIYIYTPSLSLSLYIYIYIYVYVYTYVYGSKPNLPTNIVPTNIARLKLSGRSPMDMRIPPL